MTYREIFEKAVEIIGPENISDYRPADFEGRLNGMFDVPGPASIENAIVIWLINGDRILYRAKEQ